eukprot:354542-Chlamydomonas_euryale.AAC.7
MAGTTAWTSSVWGNGRAALAATVGGGLRDGEEACMICYDERPASVQLKPCRHSICIVCVEEMRAKNIFKVMLRASAVPGGRLLYGQLVWAAGDACLPRSSTLRG